jgi:hypothetical protein
MELSLEQRKDIIREELKLFDLHELQGAEFQRLLILAHASAY